MSGRWQKERLLILVKTYPQPSSQYREITWVAGVNSEGQMRRIYPVPFRLLDGKDQFKKWDWVEADIIKPTKDYRPESHKINIAKAVRTGHIGTSSQWAERLSWIQPHLVACPDTLEARRKATGETLGVIRPTEIYGLDIESEDTPDWTENEKTLLTQETLFDDEADKNLRTLRKVPYKFYYRYRCEGSDKVFRHKITDWEISSLYWSCLRKYGPGWEEKLRWKLETEFPAKDLMFAMGTIFRHPHRWLIVGVIYPPKVPPTGQTELSFE